MFWGPAKLRQELPNKRIDPFFDDRVDRASYRLSIGHQVYVSPIKRKPKWFTRPVTTLNDGQVFAIPPGQFAFLLTHESVKVGLDEIAFISMRAKTKYRGLVNVSGFHVDPGFQGHLTFAVFNAGPVEVHLQQGDEIFLIWFSELTDTCAEYRQAAPNEISSELVNGISGKLHSLAELSGRIDKVKRRLETFHAIALIGLTLLATLIVILAGILLKIPWAFLATLHTLT